MIKKSLLVIVICIVVMCTALNIIPNGKSGDDFNLGEGLAGTLALIALGVSIIAFGFFGSGLASWILKANKHIILGFLLFAIGSVGAYFLIITPFDPPINLSWKDELDTLQTAKFGLVVASAVLALTGLVNMIAGIRGKEITS